MVTITETNMKGYEVGKSFNSVDALIQILTQAGYTVGREGVNAFVISVHDLELAGSPEQVVGSMRVE